MLYSLLQSFPVLPYTSMLGYLTCQIPGEKRFLSKLQCFQNLKMFLKLCFFRCLAGNSRIEQLL